MVRIEFNYGGEHYNIVKAQQVNDVCGILNVKKSYIQKLAMIASGTLKGKISKSMLMFIDDINFRVTPLSEDEEREYREAALAKKRADSLEWQEKRRQQPDYTEQRRGNKEVKQKKVKEVKEKKIKPPKAIKEKRVKVDKVKPKKRLQGINNAVLKDMVMRANGKNTDELQLAYHSVATKLSRKFWGSRQIIDDMIMDACVCCAKYFLRNVDISKNVFAYLTELCKRSMAATFNLMNSKNKVGLDVITI